MVPFTSSNTFRTLGLTPLINKSSVWISLKTGYIKLLSSVGGPYFSPSWYVLYMQFHSKKNKSTHFLETSICTQQYDNSDCPFRMTFIGVTARLDNGFS